LSLSLGAKEVTAVRDRMSRKANAVRYAPAGDEIGILACAVALLVASLAHAEQDPISTERSLMDVIQATRVQQRERQGLSEEGKPAAGTQAENAAEERKKSWAILPQVGLSPEKGANGGIKLTDRDVSPLHLTVDLAGSAAAEGQYHADAILISPSFGTDWLMLMAEGEYYADPTKEFFGLGNNKVGPDELSTNRHERVYGTLALGLRLSQRFALVASGAYNDVQISRGHLQDSSPSTTSRFPNLAGIKGGRSNPLSFSILFNDREDLARPTRGWRVIAKASWVPRGLGNDFEYARYLLDGSYLYPLIWRRQVIGLHLAGQYIDAKQRRVPFYELASLGSSRDLRGYFQDRFLGTSNVMTNLEYRLKLFDFHFIYDVQIDGVAFGDAGRVFIDEEDIARALGQPVNTVPRTDNDFRYSYGGGTRIALGEALVARLDIGFSDEEKGLVYLVFGHTF
jgi:Omp85 superfamily domain